MQQEKGKERRRGDWDFFGSGDDGRSPAACRIWVGFGEYDVVL